MVTGSIGRGGSGKSLTTVSTLWHLYKQGRDIVANTPLVDFRIERIKGEHRPVDEKTFGKSWAAGYIKDFEDIYNLSECEVFLDEIAAWLPNHKWKSVPDEVRRFLAQDRREGVNLHWTHRTTRIFYEVLDNTAEICRCQRYGPLILGSRYDPQAQSEKPSRRWWFVTSQLYDLYQTLFRVGALGGAGSGLGARAGYRGVSLIPLENWVRDDYHDITFSVFVRQEQLEVLRNVYGKSYMERFYPEPASDPPCGLGRYVDSFGVVRYVAGGVHRFEKV